MKDGFLIAECPRCDRDVLLAYALADDELITQCIHCDYAISDDSARAATPAELDQLGYVVPGEQSAHGERGCRDGQCGVVQPDP